VKLGQILAGWRASVLQWFCKQLEAVETESYTRGVRNTAF
jgi:hypothetical protein